jgi:hypothetical protein
MIGDTIGSPYPSRGRWRCWQREREPSARRSEGAAINPRVARQPIVLLATLEGALSVPMLVYAAIVKFPRLVPESYKLWPSHPVR